MAQTVQDPKPKRERIEIVDQPGDISEQVQKKSWLRIPIALAVAATLFLVVRRVISKKEQ
jgi:hypothetical protein